MAELVIVRFDVEDLTTPALKILKATVLYAAEHTDVDVHSLPTRVLCELAGIPTLSQSVMSLLTKEVRKALAVCEVVDTASPDREDLLYASWPVFNEIFVERANVRFHVCSRTFAPRLMVTLKALQSSSRPIRTSELETTDIAC